MKLKEKEVRNQTKFENLKQKVNSLPKAIKILVGTVATVGVIVIPFTMAMNHDDNVPVENTYAYKKEQEIKFLTDLDTVEKVKDVYLYNFDKIKNNEQIIKYDKEVTFEGALEYAKKGKDLVSEVDSKIEKADIIHYLVRVNDLEHNTSEDTMYKVLEYVLEQYYSNKLSNDYEINLYLTTYLEGMFNRLAPNTTTYKIVNTMRKLCKDGTREINDSIDLYIDKIDRYLDEL